MSKKYSVYGIDVDFGNQHTPHVEAVFKVIDFILISYSSIGKYLQGHYVLDPLRYP